MHKVDQNLCQKGKITSIEQAKKLSTKPLFKEYDTPLV